MKDKHFYLLTVSYDGSNFQGWAKQPKQFTVQGYIEEILSKVFSLKINILASSRTDKGVHAREQKFTLRLPFFLSKKSIFTIFQKNFYQYVLIKRVEIVNHNFHPIRNVNSKEYRYFINTGKLNIWQQKYRWEYKLPLKTEKLNDILQLFRGQHDFFNYCYCRKKDREKINTTREILLLDSWKKQNIVVIRIIAKSFLRYQIRAIIGETIKCYEGKQTIDNLQAKLTNSTNPLFKYRNIAPAAGLYLWKIKYEHK